MKLLEYMERLQELQTVEDVWDCHVTQMAGFGFGRLLYGFTRYRTANSFGDMQDILVLTNHPDDYIRSFIDSGMYFHAPMVRWAAENIGACSWSWMNENVESLTPTERKVLDFNLKNGVSAGFTVSFKDISSRSKGAIGLVANEGVTQLEVDEVWLEHGRDIVQMNNVAHLKLTGLPYSTARRDLTNRQREALEWVGEGKTTQDIATIMGLTPATIEKHLRLAREALNVETTAQAVLKASFQNQIFVLQR